MLRHTESCLTEGTTDNETGCFIVGDLKEWNELMMEFGVENTWNMTVTIWSHLSIRNRAHFDVGLPYIIYLYVAVYISLPCFILHCFFVFLLSFYFLFSFCGYYLINSCCCYGFWTLAAVNYFIFLHHILDLPSSVQLFHSILLCAT